MEIRVIDLDLDLHINKLYRDQGKLLVYTHKGQDWLVLTIDAKSRLELVIFFLGFRPPLFTRPTCQVNI